MEKKRTGLGKALSINQDVQRYGAFAEIGAGQEVARYFFQAGRASQTIAKTISAYDMTYSDEIYGKEESGRYVCESRLDKMLTKEFSLLQRRLAQSRGDKTSFFAFANTVATGDQDKRYCHGWMGIRFQTKPNGPSNDITMHIRMLDKHRLQQQETLGVLGVNLCYSAFYFNQTIESFLDVLLDDIKEGRLAIDLIKFSGPDLAHINNAQLNIELVKRKWCEAAIFTPDQQTVNPSDTLYNKPILIQRGNFSPFTDTHTHILQKGNEQFKAEHSTETPFTLLEITNDDQQSTQQLMDKMKSLTSKGYYVLVSNFQLFYELKNFLRSYTKKSISILMNAKYLDKLFTETLYKDLEGGLLEGLGKLLDKDTHLYIYPHKTKEICVTASTFKPADELKLIYQYFTHKNQIKDLADCNDAIESEN